MSTDIIVAGFAAIVVFLILGSLSAWLATKPIYGAYLALGLMVLEESRIPLSVNYGILLYPADLFFITVALACLIRFSLIGGMKNVPRAWWIIGAVQFILAVWGLQTYGTAAGVDYRDHFYLWVSVAFFCSVKWTEPMITRVLSAWVLCAIALCMMVFYRWIGSAVDPVYAQQIMALDTTGVRFRVISAGSTLIIAVGFLILFFKMVVGRLSLLQKFLMPMFLLTVVVLQHRSVWISLFFGTMCMYWILLRKKKGFQTTIALGTMMVVPLILLFAIPGQGNSVLDSITSSASRAISTEEGTMVGRVVHWGELLAKWSGSGDPATYLIGKPYGTPFNPVDVDTGADGIVTFDMVPHNHYIHVLYRGGLIGLFATLFLFYRLWKSGMRGVKSPDPRWSPYFVAIFAALFAFYIPYWATYTHGILLGIAISYFSLRNRQPVMRPHPGFGQPYIRAGNY